MATTPAGVTLIARDGEGNETDITEGVQVLYDFLIASMDWGSGFLTVEDVVPVVALAETCGFKDIEEARRYIEAMRSEEAGVVGGFATAKMKLDREAEDNARR